MLWCGVLYLLYYLTFLSPPATWQSVSILRWRCSVRHLIYYIIVKIIQYFFIARFPILRSGDGSDELQHFLLLQSMSDIVMSSLHISLFSRLTRAGLTPPCWMSCLLSPTLKSAGLSVVCVSKTTNLCHRNYDYLISRTRPAVRAGPGYQRPVLTTPNILWCSPASEMLKTIQTVLGKNTKNKS